MSKFCSQKDSLSKLEERGPRLECLEVGEREAVSIGHIGLCAWPPSNPIVSNGPKFP